MSALRAVLARCLRDLPGAVAPDAVLLAAYADGRDEDAFRGIVARHGPMVLRLCRSLLGNRHDAEDAFQATFLVLARRAGSLRRPDRLAAWLFGVARRIARNARESRSRRTLSADRPAPLSPADPLDNLTARELLDALDEELLRLPAAYRLPLVLVYWQGLSQDEVARRLGWSPGSAKGRLERGRKRLGAMLTRKGLAPSALLAAPVADVAMPSDLLARTAALAAAPWSKALPAAVLGLSAASLSSRLAPATAFILLLTGVGMAGLTASREHERPDGQSPIAQAPASPPVITGQRLDQFGDPLPAGAVARLGTIRFNHGEGLNALHFAPDGKTIISEGNGNFCV